MNNNEKILHVLDSYEELRTEVSKYLSVLEDRFDYVNQEKANHSDFIMNLSDLKKALQERWSDQKLIEAYYLRGEQATERAINLNEDQGVYDPRLEQLLKMFRTKTINKDLLEESLKNYPAKAPINIVITAIEQEELLPFITEEDYKNAMEYIKYYMQGIKAFKNFDNQEIIKDLTALVEWCEGYDIDSSGIEYLIDIMEIEDELPQKPDPTELLEYIREVRNPLAYISRGYTALNYYKPYISAMNHLRRVLRERREYRSVSNALQRVERAVSELREYYEGHYLQAGGMPKNTKANLSKYGLEDLAEKTTRENGK